VISDDDIAYRCVVRLKRLLELDAPSAIVRRELGMVVERVLMKYDRPDEYALRCVDAAESRAANSEPESATTERSA
jgi:hypothetical protein